MADNFNSFDINDLDILKYCTVPILVEDTNNMSFRREYDFEWELNRIPTLDNTMGVVNSIKDFAGDIRDLYNAIRGNSIYTTSSLIQDAMASGKKVAAYAIFNTNFQIFADMVSSRAEIVNIPDDEIVVERYKIGNVEAPVAVQKPMKDIVVTYIEDQYNNVYNFHKIWQECLRPGSDLCFMDIPSFSVRAIYSTTNSKLTEGELSELYNSNTPANSKVKRYSQTIYPRIFPTVISRGSANASSKNFARITVTYVRSPVITKNKSLTRIRYATGEAFPIGWKSTK